MPLILGTPQMTPAHAVDEGLHAGSRAGASITSYGTLGDLCNVFVLDAAGLTTSQSVTAFATTTNHFAPTLSPGFNHVCVTPNASATVEEAANCINIAYLL